MKAILLSLPPKQVANILNEKQTAIVRKTTPKRDLPIDVYVYCAKGDYIGRISNKYVGKVVANFTIKKVERFTQGLNEVEYENVPKIALNEYDYWGLEALMEKACLTDEELSKYVPDLSFYAWYISDLQIFDTPKSLSEFTSLGKVQASDCESCEWRETCETSFYKECDGKAYHQLKRAPSDWRYIEA